MMEHDLGTIPACLAELVAIHHRPFLAGGRPEKQVQLVFHRLERFGILARGEKAL